MNEKLNIQSLIDLLAERHGMSKRNADSFVKEFFILIEEALEKDKYVKVKGLGTFKLIDVDSRESVNVNTGERFEIQGHTKISFTPDPSLKDAINKPFSHFETVLLNNETIFEDVSLDNDNEDEEDSESINKEKPIATAAATVEKTAREETLTVPKTVVEKPAEAKPSIAAIKREEALKMEQEMMNMPTPANSATMKFFAGIVIFVILLCGGAIVYMCYPDLFDSSETKFTVEEMLKSTANKPATEAIPIDTLAYKEVAETQQEPSSTAATENVMPEQTASNVESKTDSIAEALKKSIELPKGYTVAGTETIHTIEDGESLTKVSKRFYGTTSLWGFIVISNLDIIKNPDDVPAGTRIKIPKLVKKQ